MKKKNSYITINLLSTRYNLKYSKMKHEHSIWNEKNVNFAIHLVAVMKESGMHEFKKLWVQKFMRIIPSSSELFK